MRAGGSGSRTRKERRTIAYSTSFPTEVLPMRGVFAGAASDRTRSSASTSRLAKDHFSTIIDNQLTMIRSLVNPVPNLLLTVVVGWACLLFFGYGLMAAINLLTIVMAALGALSIGSAAFLILELERPLRGPVQHSCHRLRRADAGASARRSQGGRAGRVLSRGRSETSWSGGSIGIGRRSLRQRVA